MSAAGAARELLEQSLTETAQAMRRSERRCRSAYSAPGPLREASQRLADTYARAAEVFEQELAHVENRDAIATFVEHAPGLDLAAMNRGRAAVGMPPVEHLPSPPPELVATPPEFPEGCKPTAKCWSGALVYCKNCRGSTTALDDEYGSLGDGGSYEQFQCNDCGVTTYVELPD